MPNIAIKTRLPREAWALAAVAVLFSMLSSLAQGSADPERVRADVAKATFQASVVSVAFPHGCEEPQNGQGN
jgi:hypothetical protein